MKAESSRVFKNMSEFWTAVTYNGGAIFSAPEGIIALDVALLIHSGLKSQETVDMETILCIDDDRTTSELVQKLLVRAGYSTLAAKNGHEALDILSRVRPDLIILDYMMPEMSGLQVVREIKKDPRLGDVPIVMFTAKSGINDKVDCLQAGAVGYIEKPVNPSEFVAKIRAILSRAPSIKGPVLNGMPRGRVIGITSVKGGLGASTLALNLALCLAKKTGEDVTAIETSPGEGSWGLELGVNHFGLDELLILPQDRISVEEINKKTEPIADHVRLLMTNLSVGMGQNAAATPQMNILLTALPFISPYVILDLGHTSMVSPQILNACDELVLVVDASATTIERARLIVNELAMFGFSRGGKKPLCSAPVNRYQLENTLTLAQIEQALNIPALPLIPADPSLAYRAQREKKPFMLIQPTSITCLQFMAIAQDLTKYAPISRRSLVAA